MMSQSQQYHSEFDSYPRAETLRVKYGKLLLGRVVDTERVGAWPGGLAYVMKMQSDDENISFYVRGHQFEEGKPCTFDMGVFGSEGVLLTKLRSICQNKPTGWKLQLEQRVLRLRSRQLQLRLRQKLHAPASKA